MLATPLFILEALIGFSVLIFVHELGHFLAAKWVGVRVEAFSLGFGPCLKKKVGDTEYRLSAIPLGGYVKMAGEEPKDGKKPAADEFFGKSVGQRSIVFVAGVVMNILFGFLVFILAYQAGVPVTPAVIGDVVPGDPAWVADIRADDRVVGINNMSPPVDFEDLRLAVTLGGRGKPIRLVIKRDGETIEKTVVPEYDADLGMQTIGIYDQETMQVGAPPSERRMSAEQKTLDFTAALDAGLQEGDRITAVRLAGWEAPKVLGGLLDLDMAVSECDGQPIELWFERDGVAQGPVAIKPQSMGPAQSLGVRFGSATVRAVREGSWAALAGIRVGDRILTAGEATVRSRSEAIDALTASPAEEMSVTLERAGTKVEVTLPERPAGSDIEHVLAFESGLSVDKLMPGYAVAESGLQPGDMIVSVNDKPVESVLALRKALAKGKDGAVALGWRRGNEEMKARVALGKVWMLAIPWKPSQITMRAGLTRSIALGSRKAAQWVVRIYGTLKSLIMGGVSAQHLSGPISIARLTYVAAERGAGTLLYVLGVLSVNLGVVNLLPIPVLDGGHLLFAAIEKVRGRPVSEKIQSVASYVGLSLLIGVMLLAFWNDIWSLIG